jgi:hypothetical protein
MGWRFGLRLYLFLTAGAVAATWPLVLNPASQMPYHHDPLIFTWVMTSIARRLVAHPLTLFHGDAFYPFGLSLGFNERLIPQALLGFPGFVWGNPVLTYNLLLLTLMPLNGLAMAWAAHNLTGSRRAAALAGAIFSLSPYFTIYHLNFQMLQAAGLPVAIVSWIRWLETQERRWLWAALAAITYTGLSALYYTVILSVALITLTFGMWCLRWSGFAWRRNLMALGLGGVCTGLVLTPFLLPYLAARQELGFERSLSDAQRNRAFFSTFFAPDGRHYLRLLEQPAETSAFVGFIALALAATSLVWLHRDWRLPRGAAVLARIAALGLLIALQVVVWVDYSSPHAAYLLGPLKVRPRVNQALYTALILGVALLLIHGWAHWRARRSRTLSSGDWVRLLLFMTGVLAILALGPVAVDGERPGLYALAYTVFPPLHAVRILVRFGIICIAGLALLAAFGLRAIEDRFRDRPWRWRLVLVAVTVGLGAEYAVKPIKYDPLPWHTRSVDTVLRAEPADAVVLEWPAWTVGSDSRAMLQSLAHRKRVVNGYSGFTPELLHDVTDLLYDPGPASPDTQTILRRIYPLRYLVVRLADGDFRRSSLPMWLAFRRDAPPPLFHFRGTYGSEDLYELTPTPEDGWELERLVSYDFLQRHPILEVALRPRTTGADLEQSAEVSFNGRVIRRLPLNEPARTAIPLTPPFNVAAPNVIGLRYSYRRPTNALDERYLIGRTGTRAPGDLRVMSAGEPYGDTGRIELNGVEQGRAMRRGYNLVTFDPAGRVLESATFDTYGGAEAGSAMAAWIARIPQGTVVAGAVMDEASAGLTEPVIVALRTLGVAGDIRGRYRDSHAFIGVKGAPPGSALEMLGSRQVAVSVGRVERTERDLGRVGLELTAFTMSPPAPGR